MQPSPIGDRFTVQPARPEDAQAALDLLVAAARWIKETGSPQWSHYLDYTTEQLVDLKTEAAKGELYMVKDGENLAAVFVLQGAQSEWDRILWGVDEGDAVYLHRLAVSRAYSGHGLGLFALDWAIARATELGKRYLRLDCVGWVEALHQLYSQRLTFLGEQEHFEMRFKKFEREL